jgi:hypothetical protein
MSVVFPVRCVLHLSGPYRRRVTLGGSGRLNELVGAASSGFCYGCRVEYSTTGQSCLWRRVVRLVSMPQFDRPELLSSV